MARYRIVTHPEFGDRKLAISKTVDNEPTTYVHNDECFYEYVPRTIKCPKAFNSADEAAEYMSNLK